MSPEQASGRLVDHRSDQFALGLLIYELVTRTRPFERATTAETLAATIECAPAPIGTLTREVSPELAAVVARCLAKDPADRYESTHDLARDLNAIADASSRAASAQQGRPLVAVRPFVSLSSDAAQGFFAAGMTEEIRGQLSQVSSLRLLSRTALDGLRDRDAGTLVRALGVTNFVDGSVRVEGHRVRITAELIDATTQETLWSNHYDRELADMLAVQSEVALQIAGALHTNLSADERRRLERPPTANHQAYELYLQSQQMSAGDRAQNTAAIELLQTALTLDPSFAPARARLAHRLVFMGSYDDQSYLARGNRPSAGGAADRSVAAICTRRAGNGIRDEGLARTGETGVPPGLGIGYESHHGDVQPVAARR